MTYRIFRRTHYPAIKVRWCSLSLHLTFNVLTGNLFHTSRSSMHGDYHYVSKFTIKITWYSGLRWCLLFYHLKCGWHFRRNYWGMPSEMHQKQKTENIKLILDDGRMKDNAWPYVTDLLHYAQWYADSGYSKFHKWLVYIPKQLTLLAFHGMWLGCFFCKPYWMKAIEFNKSDIDNRRWCSHATTQRATEYILIG